ncbi:MAG: hypothetical protein KVP17_003092 [Porospora cf. gigantea B]|uniref:uncharacterized protein n=1 Tax=Porospora cf. gigantea B TaxID=2853592 RepID=UPI003571D9A8|nr:MAG: hypothetical protein KVP17_003092 [Porospora cf. gigantea B]
MTVPSANDFEGDEPTPVNQSFEQPTPLNNDYTMNSIEYLDSVQAVVEPATQSLLPVDGEVDQVFKSLSRNLEKQAMWKTRKAQNQSVTVDERRQLRHLLQGLSTKNNSNLPAFFNKESQPIRRAMEHISNGHEQGQLILRMINGGPKPAKVPRENNLLRFFPHLKTTNARERPTLSLSPGRRTRRTVPDLWTSFGNDEEGLDMDPAHFYRRHEDIRRSSPIYLEACKGLYDINIVMPLSIRGASIVVDVETSNHFYAFDLVDGQPPSSQMLFGRGVRGGSPNPSRDSCLKPEEVCKTDPTGVGQSACDVWASFLHVSLGKIYNIRPDQLRMVCELFKQSFDTSLCKFLVPIQIDCAGLYVSGDHSISQSTGRNIFGFHSRHDIEQYETRGRPSTPNDFKRLIMVRRHLKMFAQRLSEVFMSGPRYEAINFMGSTPRVNVELNSNLMSTTMNTAGIRIGIREWTHLTSPAVFKDVSSDGNMPETIPRASVHSGEIRLEHTNLRMVDPRYPRDLVLGRRIVDEAPIDSDWHIESQARYVFCLPVEETKVVYRCGFQDMNSSLLPDTPSDEELLKKMLNSKFGKLLEFHRKTNVNSGPGYVAPVPTDGDAPTKDPEMTGMRFDAPVFVPSESTAPSTNSSAPSPLSACSFYMQHSCAKGDDCGFLHPADPLLRLPVDVREVSKFHPQFFP